MVLTIASVSPYIYTATTFFSLSVFSSDLLVIRICLTTAFFFLLLAGASGHDPSGSFEDSPLKSGVIDPTWLINIVLFSVHMAVCARLLKDEAPRKLNSPDEEAMYRFFSARCGVTKLEFETIYDFGNWLTVESGVSIPHCNRRLYLVLDGKISCHSLLNGKWTAPFMKRSGQFFDMKLFNFFSLPVGFDNTGFVAKTQTPARLFYWEAESLVAMAASTSPILTPYWEFCVVRSLAGLAIQRHLKKTDTLYDSLFVPEDPEWLEGARSRDFSFRGRKESPIVRFRRSLTKFLGDCKVFPPRGIRHHPRLAVQNPISGRITEEMMLIQQVDKEAGPLQEVSIGEGGNGDNTSGANAQVLSHDCYPSSDEDEEPVATGEVELS